MKKCLLNWIISQIGLQVSTIFNFFALLKSYGLLKEGSPSFQLFSIAHISKIADIIFKTDIWKTFWHLKLFIYLNLSWLGVQIVVWAAFTNIFTNIIFLKEHLLSFQKIYSLLAFMWNLVPIRSEKDYSRFGLSDTFLSFGLKIANVSQSLKLF